MKKISRRFFLSALPSGILGLGMTKGINRNLEHSKQSPEHEQSLKIKKYNPFGKTSLKVSDVSCGAISLFEPNVLRYAYDLGVNYFDTAESYLRTKSETFIGQALKDVRQKVIITTKHAFPAKGQIKRENIVRRMEDSLKRMQTDYVDIAMVHSIDNLSILENEEILAAYSGLKKEGKVRFTGFSTHNPKVSLKQALTNDFAQVVLLIYNHFEGPEIEPLLKEVHKKGIATIAMKVFAGGKQGNLKSLVSPDLSYPQAAIRWVLSNPNIDCCIVTMSSYSHVEEYIGTSGKPLNKDDLKLIAAYRRQATNQYCRTSCKECLIACPNNVAINDVLRYGMYFEDYRMEKEAILYYAQLEDTKKPLSCSSCSGPCVRACPYGLDVKGKLIHTHELLSV